MAILIFVLSFILLIAGAASGYRSLNLLPTGMGVLFALAGAVAVCAAALTFAIAVLIRRVDALAKLLRQSAAPAAIETATSSGTAPTKGVLASTPTNETALVKVAGAPEGEDEAPATEEESPININRAGHLPSLGTIGAALEPPAPQPPPSLIGSYSSAGANFKIFSDGSIEAETREGTFRFASMGDFKRHLVETEGNPQAGA